MIKNSFEQFENNLPKVLLVLERLSQRYDNRMKIIWFDQPTSIDVLINNAPYSRPHQIDPDKIERYNKAARKHLKNHKNIIHLWDSTNHAVEEYVRSCQGKFRSASQWIDTWVDCSDYIHPGYNVITHNTQILLNYMCNDVLIS